MIEETGARTRTGAGSVGREIISQILNRNRVQIALFRNTDTNDCNLIFYYVFSSSLAADNDWIFAHFARYKKWIS